MPLLLRLPASHNTIVLRCDLASQPSCANMSRIARQNVPSAYAERGFWKIVSRICPENSASPALHERLGFWVVGIDKRHGKLENEGRDCVIVERLLADDTPTGRR